MNSKIKKKIRKKERQRKLIGSGLILLMKDDLRLLVYNPCTTELMRFKMETPKKDDFSFIEKFMREAAAPAPKCRRKARKRKERQR